VLDDIAENLHVHAFDCIRGERTCDLADLLGQRDEGADWGGELAALHVHGIRDQLPRQRQTHGARHRDARLFLRLVRRGTQMGGRDDGLEGEQR